MNSENDNKISLGLKIAMFSVVVFIVLAVLSFTFLPILQTVGASFGFGLPSGSGGRAIRDVEIDVDPQVVYRIDDHRYFTLEKYMDCNSGGFVYYNDAKKKLKIFAGIDGVDKEPQSEVSISQGNNVLSFKGRFIYSASDDVIAYPYRNVNYKYGSSTHFILYKNINNPSYNTSSGEVLMTSDITVTDDSIYVQDGRVAKNIKKIHIPKQNPNDFKWIKSSSLNVVKGSIDDHFHCNDNIKPRSVKYID